MFEIIDLIRTA